MSYDALLWTCCFLVTGIIVLVYEFCVETRRLQRIVDHLEAENRKLKLAVWLIECDLAEADDVLDQKWGGRLERRTTVAG